MLDFYYAASGNSLRAAIALEESGVAYNARRLDLAAGDHKTPEFLALNPQGTVPALIERGTDGTATITLTQSAAIVTFAAETAGDFLPRDRAARAEVMRWFMVAVTDAQPTSQLLLYLTKNVPDFSEAGQRYLTQRWLDTMRPVEARLAERGGGYLCDAFSIADIALYPVIRIRRQLLEQQGAFPHLLEWAERVGDRPAVRRALAA